MFQLRVKINFYMIGFILNFIFLIIQFLLQCLELHFIDNCNDNTAAKVTAIVDLIDNSMTRSQERKRKGEVGIYEVRCYSSERD